MSVLVWFCISKTSNPVVIGHANVRQQHRMSARIRRLEQIWPPVSLTVMVLLSVFSWFLL